MFNNKLDLESTNKILKAIECFGFNKIPDRPIGFRCYFDVGIYLNETETDIFWNLLHEVLENKENRILRKKAMLCVFSSKVKTDIKEARNNLNLTEEAVKGGK